MKKRPNLTYLIIAFTFGVVGISGLASGWSELLAFLILAVAFLVIGTDDGAERTRRKAHKDR